MKHMALLAALFALLLLSFGCTGSASGVPQPDQNNQTIISGFLAVSVMLTLLSLGVIYMAAQLFRRPENEGFVSIELHQLLVTVLIYITIFGAAVFAEQLSVQFAGGSSACDTFCIARTYLNFVTNNIASPAVQKLYALLVTSQWLGSISMRWGPGAWGVVLLTNPSFIVVERVVDFLLLLISPFTSSLIVQMGILEVIRAVAIPFVLPAGVILRLFPPTRDASSFLIASALGFGIIFPFTYVMHNAIVRPMLQEAESGEVNVQADLQASGYGSLSSYISDNGALDITNQLFHPLMLMSFLLLQALFLPTLSITLTIAFIRGFSKFIGQKLG